MNTYRVTASRDGKFWMLEITGPGLKRSGATQVRRLDQTEDMARDWLATRFDLLDESAVEIVIEPVLPAEERSVVDAALSKRQAAEEAQREAAAATTAAVRELTKHDLTTRDIGVLLGISHQRVSQMVNPESAAKKRKTAEANPRGRRGKKEERTGKTRKRVNA
ncbi:MAG TPA: hypothetical protein VF069_24420 [Streptosporangiaceae bacterium]